MRNLFVVLVLAAICVSFVYTSSSCSFTNSNGVKYDLSKMTLSSSAEDYHEENSNKETFWVNICAATGGATANGNPGNNGGWCDEGQGCCQMDTHGNFNGCGAATEPYTFGPINGNATIEGVTITYTGGTDCSPSPARSATINVYCDESGTQGTITSITEPSTCQYQIEMTSKYACPQKKSSSKNNKGAGDYIGFIFIGLFFLAVIVYLVVGVIWQWRKNHATGLDLIPNKAFWFDFPFLIWDGCKFTVNKISCGRVCGGYQQL
eukprot:TRINITY_DN2586_c0_g1_i1.p1 TRINITY_DN2586_c0_g1~~TRINITY_DN2586_c0_g1_i1.p1  ORF type:complete len:264 (-),score=65.07 TRINITY_DN2586_c0_g1_i1:82-873(-)